jgi:integrase/recombinase XerC
MAELVGLDVRGSASRVAGSTTTLARPAGQGQQAPYRASGRAALTALDAWLTARSGWGAHMTRWRCLSARAAFVGAASGCSSSNVRERRGWRRQCIPCCVVISSHLLRSSGDLRAVQELSRSCQHHHHHAGLRLDFQHLAQVYDQTHPQAKTA